MKENNFILTLGIFVFLSVVLHPGVSLSQSKYSIKEMTPEIQAALDGRRDRFEKMSVLKSQGIIGENNKGYLILLKDDEKAQELVSIENSDRKLIYQAIADQNDLVDALGTIEKVFAQVQREKAKDGEKIQDESGDWVEK